MKNFTLVTNGQWSVSCTTGHGITGAVLNVFKLRGRKIQHGNCDGMIFPSSDLAFEYAYIHGYLKPFVNAQCPRCKVVHRFLGHRSGFCDVTGEFV